MSSWRSALGNKVPPSSSWQRGLLLAILHLLLVNSITSALNSNARSMTAYKRNAAKASMLTIAGCQQSMRALAGISSNDAVIRLPICSASRDWSGVTCMPQLAEVRWTPMCMLHHTLQ